MNLIARVIVLVVLIFACVGIAFFYTFPAGDLIYGTFLLLVAAILCICADATVNEIKDMAEHG